MENVKYVVTTESGYRKEFNSMKGAIEDAKFVENSLLHPIAYIHKEDK